MKYVLTVLCNVILCGSAVAGELVYTPVNPSFGGNPLNSTQLLSEASAQKPNAPTPKAKTLAQSTAQQFLQMLQARLYSSLADSVSQAILGQNSTAAGHIKLDTLDVSWSKGTDATNITLTDLSTGTITQISVPLVTQ